MPAAEARDQTLFAALLTELAKIGVTGAPGDWLTAPQQPVTEGAPGDAIEDLPLQFFVEHVGTDETDVDSGGLGIHNRTMKARIWMFAKVTTDEPSRGMMKVRQLAADCVRVLQAAESTFQVLTGSVGLRMHDFNAHRDLVPSGYSGGSLDLTVKYEQTHTAP